MTNWNHDPHGPDGKLDYAKLQESVQHGTAMLLSGQEALIDAYQLPLGDGSFLTIYHHAPSTSSHPGVGPALAAQKAYVAKTGKK